VIISIGKEGRNWRVWRVTRLSLLVVRCRRQGTDNLNCHSGVWILGLGQVGSGVLGIGCIAYLG